MKPPANRSIKRDLLRWLLLPLCALCLGSSAVAYMLASSFANDSYDRNLINTAGSVAARVRVGKDNKVNVDLPPAAQAILRHTNPKDKFYYQVLTPELERLAGDPLPTRRQHLDSNIPILRYATFEGEAIRMARIRIPLHDHPETIVLVEAAETLNSRQDLTGHILISILIPQILLILFGAVSVSFGVRKGLEPLTDLRSAVVERSRADLQPLDESIAPMEAQPLASAINELLGSLRADLDAQRRFVANAAHQLRTPLAGIQTYVELVARSSTTTDDASKNLLKQIDKGLNRMSHLTNRLLALAKAEPQAAFSFEKIDLNIVVGEAVEELIMLALEKNIELEFRHEESPALILGDAPNLKELTTNLVENAILYTKNQGTVSVSVKQADLVQLIVEDDGPGIPPEERERVFERFYRVLGTQVEGSGLGLAIVKEIASAHKAQLTLQSTTRDKGAKFIITFPAV
ncbi:MAG: sensor histidine kinase [Candidatus Obscuribacterales bacterium]|nr:sensor histidine kinase [Candidatus Obscuribacterales bacterium]